MNTGRLFTHCVAGLAIAMALAVTAPAADGPEAAKQKERELVAVLQSDAPAAEKAITCKMLAVYGSAEAVPALAPLLADERLASWARIALEAIPGPAANEALRQAVEQQQGRLLIGAINSLGERRDGQAVDALVRHLNGNDPDAAAAAAVALGKIGSDPASRALRQALAEGPEALRSAVAEGCILCAEQLLAGDGAKEAAEIYDEVRQATVPKQRIVEATRGAILARGTAGVPLLLEQLKSDDRELFRIGLMVARELPGREVADALAAELAGMPAERGAQLVLALADRSDTVVSPGMLQAARSGSKEIRLAAVGLLRRLGDASCVPTLLEVALDSDEELAQNAKDALAQLPGDDVNAAIQSRLSQAEGAQLALLIDVVGQRRVDASTTLLKHVDHADATIRRAALTALGETVGPDNLAVLIQRVAQPKQVDDASVAQRALRAACVRMPDREACAAQLAAALPRAPSSARQAYLETLGAMGGAKALQTIHAAAKGNDPELQDVGSRLLGEWMTVDAAPVLFDLTRTAPAEKFRIRALRGYIRLARQFTMPIEQRAEICDKALAAAQRPDEQKLVLQVLERYPSVETLRIAVKAARISSLKADGERAAMTIAQKLGGNSAGAQELLAQIGQTPVKVEIIKAVYGSGSSQKDVTQLLRKHAGSLRLITLPSPKYNTNFGGDPAPGVVKQLKIDYRIDGKAGSASFAEDATILLPLPK